MSLEEDRHSKAFDAELIVDPVERAKREARNGLKQYDYVIEAIDYWLSTDQKFKLRPSLILHLNRLALEGISAYAGNYRPSEIKIEGSQHQPVGAHLVPEKVEELCDYVNEHWDSSAIHLAAYAMWRLNWIHPFADGNGRTSRALSYLLLSIRLGEKLPGTLTIPDQISNNKNPYYAALEAADSAFAKGSVEVKELEKMLKSFLAAQLLSVVRAADEPGKTSQS